MDDLATRIQEYVEIIYPDIKEDLDVEDEYIEFLVGDVIDRALVFMNRDQLVDRYETDLEENPVQEDPDFWINYQYYPIPPRLEKTLAKVVVGVAKTVVENNTAELGAITKVKDGVQEVTYASQLTTFLNSGSESEIFSGSLELLRRYLLPTIVRNEDTEFF